MTPTSSPRIGVLAIQGDYDAHAQALRDAGVQAVLIRRPEQLSEVDGLIIPGGESTTFLKFLERDGFLTALQDFVRSRPTFGTCAGCILLAKEVLNPAQQSLGVLDITVERNAYGRQIDSIIEEAATQLPGGPMEFVYIRAPRITRTGPGVEILAAREGYPVLVQEGRLLAATFHPELSADRRIHQRFLELVAHHKADHGKAAHPETAGSKPVAHKSAEHKVAAHKSGEHKSAEHKTKPAPKPQPRS
jgi:5'-phosphate synthase pdxT subunit